MGQFGAFIEVTSTHSAIRKTLEISRVFGGTPSGARTLDTLIKSQRVDVEISTVVDSVQHQVQH